MGEDLGYYQDVDQSKEESGSESQESSEEDTDDSGESEELFDDKKFPFQDLLGSEDDTVFLKSLGHDLYFLQIAFYIGIFMGVMLLTFGWFICFIRLLRMRAHREQNVIQPAEQVKNVKLSGIVKSYSRLPVHMRNMKPSNVAYEKLYEVV